MQPLAQPFIGSDYESHPLFSGRLLIVAESAYLTEKDRQSDFTVGLLQKVSQMGRTSGTHVTFYRKLFFVLTGDHFRTVTDDTWTSVWNSLGFYHFVQTPLSRPRERPTQDAWKHSVEPFVRPLRDLRPDLILMPDTQLAGHLCHASVAKIVEDPMLQVPIPEIKTASATYVLHPSSWGFRLSAARRRFERLIGVDLNRLSED